MSDPGGEEVEVVPSGLALQQVSAWLGVDAQAVLAQETDPAVEAMFDKPHPSLLGLGAKYLSHKSMEASGLELKLKHKLRKSARAAEADEEQQQHPGQYYQPAQLDRHHQHNKRRRQEHHHQHQQQQQQYRGGGGVDSDDSDDEEGGGKLGQLTKPPRKHSKQAVQSSVPSSKPSASKVLDRSQLLQVPTEQLSKWQRKRLREKAKRQQQQQQHQGGVQQT